MRGSIGRRLASTNPTFISRTPFSTFSGRGRGRGDPFSDSSTPHRKPIGEENVDAPIGTGAGHGRGTPIGSNPPFRPRVPPPPPSPSMGRGGFNQPPPGVNPSIGRGGSSEPPPSSGENPYRGRYSPPQGFQPGGRMQTPGGDRFSPPQDSSSQSGQPLKPIFFRREDTPDVPDFPKQWPMQNPSRVNNFGRSSEDVQVPWNLHPGVSGLGRGQPMKVSGAEEMPAEVNRHVRQPRQDKVPLESEEGTEDTPSEKKPKLSREEAAKKAIEVLSRGGAGGGGEGGSRGGDFSGRGGRGSGASRGRGGRGRGRGRGRVGGRGRGGGGYDSGDDEASELYLGPDADGEKFAQSLGPVQMEQLTQAFEEMSYRVLPSPAQDAFVDAQDTNNMIEYEPEYLMNFDNPDIDDKPPIPLPDALEKMKPFLMAYEGVKSQEEWEEIIDELMKQVPQMKELMDDYCGPNRVTAKQQQQELERVADTIPENVPSSVKRFTDRAVLSLQSNPGWGWDKKCQFMDKLAWEVNQQYK